MYPKAESHITFRQEFNVTALWSITTLPGHYQGVGAAVQYSMWATADYLHHPHISSWLHVFVADEQNKIVKLNKAAFLCPNILVVFKIHVFQTDVRINCCKQKVTVAQMATGVYRISLILFDVWLGNDCCVSIITKQRGFVTFAASDSARREGF